MTTPSGKLLLVATLATVFACAGALASAPRAAAPSRSPGPAAAGIAPAAATCTGAPAPAPAPILARRPLRDEGCTDAAPPPQLRSKVFHQLSYHSHFPATRGELLASFRSTSELTADELAWVADRLPASTLTSAAGTLSRLFPDAPAHLLSRLAGVPTLATLATR